MREPCIEGPSERGGSGCADGVKRLSRSFPLGPDCVETGIADVTSDSGHVRTRDGSDLYRTIGESSGIVEVVRRPARKMGNHEQTNDRAGSRTRFRWKSRKDRCRLPRSNPAAGCRSESHGHSISPSIRVSAPATFRSGHRKEILRKPKTSIDARRPSGGRCCNATRRVPKH